MSDIQLSDVEWFVLRQCAAPEMVLGDGSEEQSAAFDRLEALGVIAKNQLPSNDFFWPTALGLELLELKL